MGLKKWAEGVTKDVFLKWKSYQPLWEPGFKVFFGPVRENPEVMIISLNPGGNGDNFRQEDYYRFESGDFSPPTTNVYVIRQNPMARKVRKFFDGHEKMLERSVAFTVLFFRSKNIKEWKRLDKQKRKEMEEFSYKKVKEIIDKVKPKAVLVVGFATYRRLKKHVLDGIKDENPRKGKSGRLSLTADWNGVPLFCIPHLTGARVTNGNVDKNRKMFFKIIEKS
jgi:hypothetical protein